MIELRPYQTQIIDDARAALSRHRSCLVVSATGSGKTALAAFMLGTARQKQRRSWFIAHRDFLLDQTAATFDKVGIPYGFIAAGRPYNEHHAIQIVSVGTATRRLDVLPKPDVIVWDECHHIGAASYEKIYDWAETARHVGLSATPTRLDGKGLGKYFAEMVSGPSVSWLIRHGYLSPYRAYAPSAPRLEGVHTVAGDYNRGELGAVMDTNQIIGDMVRHYREKADGKRGLYFGVSIEHSERIAAAFRSAGIPAVHIDGTTSTNLRSNAARDFANGEIKIISNVDIAGEGYDLSAQSGTDVTVECVGLARPTQSLSLHIQHMGRGLRPKPDGSAAIILDHAGNLARHGLPDADREWSLEGRKAGGRKTDGGAPVATCKTCFGVFGASARVCPYCGEERGIEAREVEEIAGELVEIDHARIAEEKEARKARERQEQGQAKTTADLVQLARKRGYKNPGFWAINVMKSRGVRA